MKSTRYIICLLLGMLWTFVLYAQDFEYKGYVVSDTHVPLENASVALLHQNQSILDFTFTDSKGYFSIKVNTLPTTIFISHLGYQAIHIPTGDYREGTSWELKTQNIKLKEVKITSHRIRERQDTLIYNVSGFKMPQDKSIADVLKKMPGIEVSSSGQIKFEDKAISKLYIEGMDLMGDQYALATNNLSGKSVKSVQVLRNHQDISALRGKQFSEQAAINLVLEDNVKYTLTGTTDMGGGYTHDNKMLWDARIQTMLFGKKNQNLSLYKTNNTGVNTENEIISQIQDSETRLPASPFLLVPPAATISDIDERNYLVNRDHLGAIKHLYQIKEGHTIRTQLNYLNKKEEQESNTSTLYFYPEHTIRYDDQNLLNSHIRQLSGEIAYQQNTAQTYIKNIVKGKWTESHTDNPLQANSQPINQSFRTDRKEISNQFQWVRPYGNTHLFRLTSIQAYEELPQVLTVAPGLYQEWLNDSIPYEQLRQDVHLYNFYSINRMELQTKLFGFHLGIQGGADYIHQNMNSDCRPAATVHALRVAHTRFYVAPTLRYTDESWKILFTLPLSYHLFRLDGHSSPSSHERHRLVLPEPSLTASYQLNAYWSIHQSLHYRSQMPDITQLYPHYIITNYREASKGSRFYPSKNLLYSATVKFSNPLNGLFCSIGSRLHVGWQEQTPQSQQYSDLHVTQMIEAKHRFISWNVHSKVSKTFSFWKTFIGITGNYTHNRQKTLLYENLVPFQSQTLTFAPAYATQPLKQLSIEGKTHLSYSTLKSSITPYTHILKMSSNIEINVFPTTLLKLKWTHSLFNNYHPVRSSIYFMNLSTTYSFRKFDLELLANNLLNNKEHQQTYLYTLTEHSIVQRFRSREILLKASFWY